MYAVPHFHVMRLPLRSQLKLGVVPEAAVLPAFLTSQQEQRVEKTDFHVSPEVKYP